jgi:hypothetical protein
MGQLDPGKRRLFSDDPILFCRHVSNTAVKTKTKQKGQASTETHADGELRNSHKERKCGETQICTQEGARPPTWAVNPQMGEPRGNEYVRRRPLKRRSVRPSLPMPNDPA